MKTYVIEWRLNHKYPFTYLEIQEFAPNWTPLEGEEWLPEGAAQERLKYWQGLSLAKLLEFRVVEVNR